MINYNFVYKPLNTKLVWGLDYFMTDPYTNGTILGGLGVGVLCWWVWRGELSMLLRTVTNSLLVQS